MASLAFFGTPLRAIKSFQPLKRPPLLRALMIALARAERTFSRFSGSAPVAAFGFTSWAWGEAGRRGGAAILGADVIGSETRSAP
jgi:hypothetical protein